MCNLYSLRKTREETLGLFNARCVDDGAQFDLPLVFPDTMAPVVRLTESGTRELQMMRWGFPPPPTIGSRPVTNVRNTKSPYWRSWLRAEFRCLVPATAFCEWTDTRPKVPHWFATRTDRPLFAFAGIWRPWTGERKGLSGVHQLFAFLTTDPNDVVRPVHAKAMPVLLIDENDFDAWLTGSVEEALALQKPGSGPLDIVATGIERNAG
jgi:putative SOS response-associated peptidase YedK